MVGNDEVLLDAIVSIKPDKDFLSAIDNVTDAAIKRMQEKFGAAVIKGPNVSGSQASGQPDSSLEASVAQAESRREASAHRILEIKKQIEAAEINLNSGSLDVSKVNTLVRLEKELRSATDQEAIAKKEVLDLNSQILAATQQQIAQQNALTAATQATAAGSQQQIDKLDAEIDRVNKEKADARQVKASAAVEASVKPKRKDASDAYLRANQEFLRVEDELNKLIEQRRVLYAQLTQQQQQAAAAAQATAAAQAAAANPPAANPPAGNPPAGNPPAGNPPGANPPAGPNPPGANPPGANPPGGTNPPNLAAQFNNVTAEVRRLQQSLRDLSFFKVQIKTEESKREFESLRSQIADIKLFIQEADVTDPFALNEAIARAAVLRDRMRELSSSTYTARSNKEEFDIIAARAKAGIAAETLKSNTTQRQLQGLSADDRTNIIMMTYAIKQQQQEVMRLSQMFDGTADSVKNLDGAYKELQARQTAMNEMQEGLINSGERSFNTLSNNAYQAGQAIEDFAVGYSLNGFAGGIRGAANNVAFLLNDMSRLKSVQDALPKGWAKQLPFIAGIGSALAITVLPPLIEWLQSLNDIEIGLKDISEELKRLSEDADFDINLRVENDSLSKSLKNAESVRDVLKQINELGDSAASKKTEIGEIFGALNQPGRAGFPDIIADMEKLRAASLKALEPAQGRLARIKEIESSTFRSMFDLSEGLAPSFLPTFTAESGSTLRKTVPVLADLEAGLRNFRIEAEKGATLKNGIGGVANVDNLKELLSQIDIIKQKAAEAGELNILDTKNKAELQILVSSIGELEPRLKKVLELEKEIVNTTQSQFIIAFDAARKKVSELQSELDLQNAVNLGVNVEFDLDLLALETQINKGRQVLNEATEQIKLRAKPGPETDAGIRALQEQFKASALVDLGKLENKELSEREKLEEKILSLKERQRQSAKFTTLEEFAKNLQINALSGEDEEAKRLKELRKEQDELNGSLENSKRIKADIGGINRGEFLEGVATRPRVPQGSAGTGFQPFFGDIMKQFTESALNFQQPDNQQLKPEDIKQAVSDGVREGMKVLSEGFGGKAVDALKNLKGVAVTQ